MKYEIVELEQKMVEGIGIRTTNENGKAMQDIGILWQKFLKEGTYEEIPHKVGNKAIGLYTDYEGDCTRPYYFMAGCEVSEPSGKGSTKIIPKGKYAKFVIKGDVVKAVGKAWEAIWQMDLKRTYTGDFEEYQNNSGDEQNQEIHIYVAIEA